RRREHGKQTIVAHEGHIVEIELGLELVRNQRVVHELPMHAGPENADDERRRDRRADAGGETVRAAAERSDVARELLRRRGNEHVKEKRDEGALAETREHHAGHDHAAAPIVADDGGEERERDRRDEKSGARDEPRAREAIERDDEHGRREARERERDHGRGGGEAAAALDDLNIERDQEREARADRAYREHREQRRALGGRIDDVERDERRLAGCFSPAGPHDEPLYQEEARDDHHRRRRQVEHAERRRRARQEPAPFREVVRAYADQED